MIILNMKRIFRNKWLIIKMLIVSPIVKILPIVLIQNVSGSIDSNNMLNLCLWSFFYFSVFESINMKMSLFSSEKISEIMISKTSLLRFHVYEMISLIIAFIPSYIGTLIMYSVIYNLEIPLWLTLICTFGIIFCDIIVMMMVMLFELRFSNYFNKFNFMMNIIYLLSGVTYPITIFPYMMRGASYLLPISFVFSFSQQPSLSFIICFMISSIILFVIIYKVVVKEQERFIERGGIS